MISYEKEKPEGVITDEEFEAMISESPFLKALLSPTPRGKFWLEALKNELADSSDCIEANGHKELFYREKIDILEFARDALTHRTFHRSVNKDPRLVIFFVKTLIMAGYESGSSCSEYFEKRLISQLKNRKVLNPNLSRESEKMIHVWYVLGVECANSDQEQPFEDFIEKNLDLSGLPPPKPSDDHLLREGETLRARKKKRESSSKWQGPIFDFIRDELPGLEN